MSFHFSRRRQRPAQTARVSAPQPSPAQAIRPVPVQHSFPPDMVQALESSPFAALGLSLPLLRAVSDESYTDPTPIQIAVVQHVLQGRDVLACAQTGTGKTAAFVLPILQRLAAEGTNHSHIRALVLTPTRELAAQIAERVSAYGRYLGLRHAVVYGGVSQRPQEAALRGAPHVLIATPGRLIDLIQQGLVRLDGIKHFVLDEADRMLDMGFVRDVRRIAALLPHARQTLLFSATIPMSIETLAQSMLVDPVRVSVKPAVTTAENVDQSVVFVARADKRVLLERVLRDASVARAIVFTRTKHGANRLANQLESAGIDSAAIHGNKSQGARERALDAFRAGTMRVLIATDVASRGIDVDGISHVINYDLPNVAETYVHRIGRTGRAGATGSAISFCDREEREMLADIEKLIRRRLPVVAAQSPSEQTEFQLTAPRAPEAQIDRRPSESRAPPAITPPVDPPAGDSSGSARRSKARRWEPRFRARSAF